MRRRNADRAAPITAERCRAHAAGNGSAGSSRGPPGGPGGIPWVARCFENGVVSCAAVAELRDIRLSKYYRPCSFDPLHHDVVFVWHEIAIGDRTRGRDDAFGADQVLHSNGYSGQQPDILARGDVGLEFSRHFQRQFRRRGAEGMKLLILLLHPVYVGLCHLDRRYFARFYFLCDDARVHLPNFGCIGCHRGSSKQCFLNCPDPSRSGLGALISQDQAT